MKLPNRSLLRLTRRVILAASIAPAAFALNASGAAVTWDGSPVSLDNSPTYTEGLREGRLVGVFDETSPNPMNGPNGGVSTGIRMGQDPTNTGADQNSDVWADNRTWVYTGQINAGANGTLSFAESIDDNASVKIDGITVLRDQTYNNTTASGVLNFLPNSWHTFEVRLGNGGGGAGPVGIDGFTSTYGFGFSQTGGDGRNGANYTKPEEIIDGTATVLRYLITPVGGDDVTVEDSTVVTVTGTDAEITENSIAFSPLFGSETLTVNNDAAAIQRTLSSLTTVLGGTAGDSISINGSANFRPGVLSDGGRTGISLNKIGGTGDLILDGVNGTPGVAGVTLTVSDGRVSIIGDGRNPLATMTNAIQVTGPNAKIRFGSTATGTAFNNAINFTDSATLEHTFASRDILSGAVTIGTGKTVTAAISGGALTVTGTISGGDLVKTGNGTLGMSGPTNLSSLTINGGRTEVGGVLTLPSAPVLVTGTLALSNTNNSIPGPFVVPAGATLEGGVGTFGSSANALNLTGGTLRLIGANIGLNLNIYDADPNSPSHNAYSGILNTIAGVQTYFGTLSPTITTLTSANGNTSLSYAPIPDNGSPFAIHGSTDADTIQALFTGKYLAASAGDYNFTTASDDGSTLYIDGTQVVANNFGQAITPRSGTITLAPGYHDITITYNEGGGGAGLTVDVQAPGDANSHRITNSELFTATPATTANPLTNAVNVQADSTIDVSGTFGATAGSLTIQPGKTLTVTGSTLTANTVNLNSSGQYGFSGNGTVILTTIDDNSDGSAGGGAYSVNIVKSGSGVLVLDNTTTPQLQNANSSINVQDGAVGLLLSTGGQNPLGQAQISFNGGGLVLSSKAGPQTFQIPTFNGNGLVQARQIGSGVAGETITLTGSLAVGAAQTITLGTADNYTLRVGGAASGTGNVVVTGNGVIATTTTALQGVNVAVGTASAPATLKLNTATPSIGSLQGVSFGSSVVVGNGSGATVLTVNGSSSGRFNGVISEAAGSPTVLVKSGTGTLTLGGANTFTGAVNVTGGILELRQGSIGTNPINVSGGTLQFLGAGLLGQFYSGDEGGANTNFAGNFTTYANYFAGRTPTVVASTAAGGVTQLSYDPTGGDTAMFSAYGFQNNNNIVSRMSGQIAVPQAGSFTFTTSSDDGSVLFIDGQKVVDNNFFQGITARSGTITLTGGLHSIDIGYYEGGGGNGLVVQWAGPGFAMQVLQNSALESTSLYTNTGNPVNISGTGTIDPRGGVNNLGNLTLAASSTLATTAGTVNFAQTALSGSGIYNFNVAGTVATGQILDNGDTVTINKSGAGNLVLNSVAPQLSDATNVINVAAGNVVAVGGASSPLGGSTVNLNGGGLGLSSTVTAETAFNNVVNVNASSTITAGNFGGGAVNGGAAVLGSPLTVAGGQTLTVSATNGYTLGFASSITGAGNVRANGGAVTVNGDLSVNNVDVTRGTLNTVGALNGNVVSVGTGAVLRTSGTLTANSLSLDAGSFVDSIGNVTATNGSVVNDGATLAFNGNTYSGAPISVNGGTVMASTGVTDLGSSISFAPIVQTLTPNTLRGRFLGTGGEFVPSLYPGNTEAGLRAVLSLPAIETAVTGALAFPTETTIAALFGGANTGQRYTASFDGTFTAPVSGDFGLQVAGVDDNAGFWVDLNQNGTFEANGSSGSELISSKGAPCCGDGPVGFATLVGGQSYRIAIAVEDTGGEGTLTARGQLPAAANMFVINPSDPAQAGFFSTSLTTGGGGLNVAAGAELRVATVNNATDLLVNGTLVLNNTTDLTSNVGSIRTLTGGVVDLATGNNLTASSLSLTTATTLTKSGLGTLSVGALDMGADALVSVDAGLLRVTGNGAAAIGANGGTIQVNDTASLSVSGAIAGSVIVNTGGNLSGNGRVADLTLRVGATMSVNLVPSFTPLRATGNVVLEGDVPINLTLGFDPVDFVDSFALIQNDGANSVLNNGFFVYGGNALDEGETFIVNSGAFSQQFTISYNGGDGNDVVLAAVPEPGTWATVMSGLGMLVGLQRFRRRRNS